MAAVTLDPPYRRFGALWYGRVDWTPARKGRPTKWTCRTGFSPQDTRRPRKKQRQKGKSPPRRSHGRGLCCCGEANEISRHPCGAPVSSRHRREERQSIAGPSDFYADDEGSPLYRTRLADPAQYLAEQIPGPKGKNDPHHTGAAGHVSPARGRPRRHRGPADWPVCPLDPFFVLFSFLFFGRAFLFPPLSLCAHFFALCAHAFFVVCFFARSTKESRRSSTLCPPLGRGHVAPIRPRSAEPPHPKTQERMTRRSRQRRVPSGLCLHSNLARRTLICQTREKKRPCRPALCAQKSCAACTKKTAKGRALAGQSHPPFFSGVDKKTDCAQCRRVQWQ